MPRPERHLRDFLDPLHKRSGPHLPPARAHLRAVQEDYRAAAPPGASFPRKLSAFLQNQVWAWIVNYLAFRFGPKHAFVTYSNAESGIYPLAAPEGGPIRVGIAGDWATGTQESAEIAALIRRAEPHFTIHIGDVYFAGDDDEVRANCLGESVSWPRGSVASFSMNGNHEMYANGNGYFDVLLPALGQKTSYFCLRNDYWDVLALDTGYNSVGIPLLEKISWFSPDCKLRPEILSWLRETVKPGQNGRGVMLLTHHQYFSAFEDEFPKPAQQIAEFLQRPVLWLWGHEHRFAIYGKARIDKGIEAYGRCLGHGGMPVDIGIPPVRSTRPLVAHDERRYDTLDQTDVGFNGLAQVVFDGPRLTIDYRDIRDTSILTETWEVVDGELRGRNITLNVSDPKFVVERDLSAAITDARSAAGNP